MLMNHPPGPPRLLVLLVLLSGAARVFAQECDPAASAQEVMTREAAFVAQGQAEGARAASLTYLADDAIMFEPGPVNAKKIWTSRPEGGLSLKWEPVFVGMARSCDLAFTTGPAEWRKNKEDEKPLGHGQYISIWKKQPDDAWKVVVDVGGAVPAAKKVEEEPAVAISPAAAGTTGRCREETARGGEVVCRHGADGFHLRSHRLQRGRVTCKSRRHLPSGGASGRGTDAECPARETKA